MPYLVAGVGALGLLNLLLTLAVVRRLREHAELLAAGTHTPGAAATAIAVGERPGAFSTVDTGGGPVTGDGPRLFGFFSVDCGPCEAKLPDFVAQVAGYPGGRARVVAVVAGGGPKRDRFTTALAGVARVVVEPPDGPVATAFRVDAFPTWCVLDEHGVVQHSGVGLDGLDAAVPVPARA